MIPESSIYLARFWGSLFIILGSSALLAGFLGRVIEYTKDRAIIVSTGYITLLLGLGTVVLHNLWVFDWRISITLIGWITLGKGIMKVAFPEHIRARAQVFKTLPALWGAIIFLIGAWFLYKSFT